MLETSRAISFFPPWTGSLPLQELELRGDTHSGRWACQRPREADWGEVARGLHRASEVLRRIPIQHIVDVIDRAARRWSDRDFPLRAAARESVAEATGFSPEAVDESFDVELRNYRADSLQRVLRRELRDPRMLDGFAPDAELGGCVRAVGPRITLDIFTGNVPGLPALALVRALLVKSAVIAKVASGEPSFAQRFVQSLAEIDSRLSDAIVVTYWARDEGETLSAILQHVDAVVAYGSDEACAQIRTAVPPHVRFVEHGHKLSVGVLSRSFVSAHGLEAVAEQVARDTSVFNQHACIAPQAYFLEGDDEWRRAFGRALADALARYGARCPVGELDDADAAAIQLERAAQAWNAANDPSQGLWHDHALEWSVTLEPGLVGARGLGNRFLRLVGIEHVDEALTMLQPFARHLQNVALGVGESDLPRLSTALAELGASRICSPGRMADPSMMWRHDGRMCVAELLRFCDVEMHESSTAIANAGGGR